MDHEDDVSALGATAPRGLAALVFVGACIFAAILTGAGSFDAGLSSGDETRPFSADSPWNTRATARIRFAAVDDPRTSDLRAPAAAINAAAWSLPVYEATDDDPVRTVTTSEGRFRYRIPDDAEPAAPAHGDRHLLVIDPAEQWVDECWVAEPAPDGFRCRYHVRNRLRGLGVGEGGTRAYGGSALAGLIRTWELEQGAIRHALAFALPRDRLRHGPVWPATSEDGDAVYGGHLPMGSFVAIPRGVDLDDLGLSVFGLAVARALQDYGAYLVDASENFTLYAEPSAEGMLVEARSDLDTIRDELRVATDHPVSRVG